MKSVVVALLAVAGVVIGAWAASLAAARLYPLPDDRYPPRDLVVQSKPGAYWPAGEADCTAHRGFWSPMGASGRVGCQMPTADAGRACSDSRQCEGLCEAPEGVRQGAYVMGHCTDGRPVIGCHDIVTQGRAWGICHD